MKFVMIAVLVLGAIVGGSLIVYGIKNDEPGFWLWAGFVLLGVFLLFWYMKRLRENPPSQRPLRGPGDDI